jgi:hypothetical protein
VSPDDPEASGLDDALFGEDTAPNPVVRLPGTTDRDDALDDALFGAEPSAAGPTGVRADDDPSVAAALFGADAAAPPPPHADDGAWVAAAAAADPAADASLFDDAPGGVGAGATVRRAPIDRGPRRGARGVVAAVAALLVLGLGGVAYAVLATRDDGQGKPKVKVQGVSATASSRPADPSTSSTTSTTAATTTTVAPTTTTAPPTTTPAPVATTPEAPVVTEPPVEIPPPVDTDPTTTTTTTAPPTTTTTTTP